MNKKGAGLEELVQSGRSKEAEREAQMEILEKEKALLEVVVVEHDGGGMNAMSRSKKVLGLLHLQL